MTVVLMVVASASSHLVLVPLHVLLATTHVLVATMAGVTLVAVVMVLTPTSMVTLTIVVATGIVSCSLH